jgi:hypothetical protein
MKELNTFGFGIIVGITLVAITLQFTTSPVEIKKKMEKEAISHGLCLLMGSNIGF